jgi:hypothetical protein
MVGMSQIPVATAALGMSARSMRADGMTPQNSGLMSTAVPVAALPTIQVVKVAATVIQRTMIAVATSNFQVDYPKMKANSSTDSTIVKALSSLKAASIIQITSIPYSSIAEAKALAIYMAATAKANALVAVFSGALATTSMVITITPASLTSKPCGL